MAVPVSRIFSERGCGPGGGGWRLDQVGKGRVVVVVVGGDKGWQVVVVVV
jgi:hypothetical protein